MQQCPNCKKEISRAAATKCPHCGMPLGHTPPLSDDMSQHKEPRPKSGSCTGLLSCLIIIAIVGIVLAILLPALAKRRPRNCSNCGRYNLKQLGLVLSLYANENDDHYPPIDNRKNNFIFDANLIYPNYLTDLSILVCPDNQDCCPENAFRLRSEKTSFFSSPGDVHPDCVSDASYCYLGWVVTNDEEAKAFFEAYDRLSPEDYVDDIEVVGEETNDKPIILKRLSSSVDRFFITDINAVFTGEEMGSSIIPIMWDRPYTDPESFAHKNWETGEVGGYVLYLDGHYDFVVYGEFPMTETMARLLEERPQEPIPDCEE